MIESALFSSPTRLSWYPKKNKSEGLALGHLVSSSSTETVLGDTNRRDTSGVTTIKNNCINVSI